MLGLYVGSTYCRMFLCGFAVVTIYSMLLRVVSGHRFYVDESAALSIQLDIISPFRLVAVACIFPLYLQLAALTEPQCPGGKVHISHRPGL